jgi:hypothetical protein
MGGNVRYLVAMFMMTDFFLLFPQSKSDSKKEAKESKKKPWQFWKK